jgi:hypothetical protein
MREIIMVKSIRIVRSTTLPFTYQSGGLKIGDESSLIIYLQAQRLPEDKINQARQFLNEQGNVTISIFDDGRIEATPSL